MDLKDMDFADGPSIFATSYHNIQEKTDKLDIFVEQIGLNMNLKQPTSSTETYSII